MLIEIWMEVGEDPGAPGFRRVGEMRGPRNKVRQIPGRRKQASVLDDSTRVAALDVIGTANEGC